MIAGPDDRDQIHGRDPHGPDRNAVRSATRHRARRRAWLRDRCRCPRFQARSAPRQPPSTRQTCRTDLMTKRRRQGRPMPPVSKSGRRRIEGRMQSAPPAAALRRARRTTPASQPRPMPATNRRPRRPDTIQSGSALSAGSDPEQDAQRIARGEDRQAEDQHEPAAGDLEPAIRDAPHGAATIRGQTEQGGQQQATAQPAAASRAAGDWAMPANEVTSPTSGRIASRAGRQDARRASPSSPARRRTPSAATPRVGYW